MRTKAKVPFGQIPCPDPDCLYPDECYGRPENFGETTEPETCEACGSTEAMDWVYADKVWVCSDCGQAHVEKSALK